MGGEVRTRLRAVGSGEPGVVLPGGVLTDVGLLDAPVNPEHAVIYLVEAVTG